MTSVQLFNQILRSRRSVFPDQFDAGKRIDDAIVREILTNATHAPDHGKSQPWRFTVFTGAGLSRFARFQSELYKLESGDRFKEASYIKMQQNPLKASHIVAIGMKRTTARQVPEVEDLIAVACAIENIYLSLAAYGLGGYLTTGGVTYLEKARSYFQLGEQDKLLGFFYMGHVAHAAPPVARVPLEERLTWIDQAD